MKRYLLLVFVLVVAYASSAFAQMAEDNIAYLRVQKLIAAGNYQRAVGVLEGLSAEAKASPFFPSYSAECYEHLGDYEKAKLYYKRIYTATGDMISLQKAADMEEMLADQQEQQRAAQQKVEVYQTERNSQEESRLKKEHEEKVFLTEKRRANKEKNQLMIQFLRNYLPFSNADTLKGIINVSFYGQAGYHKPFQIDMESVKEVYIKSRKFKSFFDVDLILRQKQHYDMDIIFSWKNRGKDLSDFKNYLIVFTTSMKEMGITVHVDEKI